MEKAAEPGGIRVGADVVRQTRGSFQFGEALSLQLKGKSEPMVAYPLLRARPVGRPKRGLEGLDTPLVGREIELAQLEQAIGDLKSGRGQIVLVVGEAGIGKSRLLAEARKRFAQGLTWAEGRSLSYGAHQPFHPVVDAIRELAGITPTDSATLTGLPPDARTRHRPLLESLLNLPLDRRSEAAELRAAFLPSGIGAGRRRSPRRRATWPCPSTSPHPPSAPGSTC